MIKTITTKTGREMHYLDGKLISQAKFEELQTIDQANTDAITKAGCVFCGEPTTRSKLINLKVIRLCEDDYLSKTTGEIAQQLRGTNA